MKVIKRNGTEVDFNIDKIINAIDKASTEVSKNKCTDKINIDDINMMAENVYNKFKKLHRAINVEEIQDEVELQLMEYKRYDIAKAYIKYRYEHELLRASNNIDDIVLTLIDGTNEEIKQENSNKNPKTNSTQRDYVAGEVSKDITRRKLLTEEINQAHKEGLIHFHDADYFLQHMHNCCLINLEDMLQNGTIISDVKIDKPHSFTTACNIATQIVAQVASSQYGGQSISLTHLAPFVDVSRQAILKQVKHEVDKGIENGLLNIMVKDYQKYIDDVVNERLKKEIEKGIQTIQYQLITLMTTNGQAPFITIFMYLNEARNEQEKEDLAMIIEEVIKQRYLGVKNRKDVRVTIAFPKLIYVLEEDNITEDSKYWYLTKLAAKCTAKRLVPDYISEKKMLEYKVDANGKGHCYTPMGCRSFLTPYLDKNGNPKYYGRFNSGVVTINLVDIALSSSKNIESFWDILDERCELCHKALQIRHKRLRGTKSDVAPILWQAGALARLESGETIDKLLFDGYSTLSLGYAGLWECVYYLTGKKLTEPEGEKIGLEIMQKLNDYCNKWKDEENIAYSLYGTPMESTTYKFAKCLQKRFGIIEGVTDKNYITNSYHIKVTEPVDAFTKLQTESKFQKLSPGGAISYVEIPNMEHNIEAVLEVIKCIYDTIMYAELNTKSDYCQICGYSGEIQIIKKDNKYIWHCPNCGNEDFDKMNVARRVCGYISTNDMNQGRMNEIEERVLHLS